MTIAQNLKLEIMDLEEGIYGYDVKDQRYGLEVVRTTIDVGGGGLGIELTEMASGGDGRGLVLVSGVLGAAAEVDHPLALGDVLTGVSVEGTDFRERLTALNYDLTVEAIGRAKAVAGAKQLSFEADRLVERAPITVQVVEGDGNVKIVQALAGENLRRLLQRKSIQLYDRNTKRFDMPYATGDCAGEGLCGTCLVKVEQGMDLLSPKDSLETLITKGRPLSWRASCRTVVGPDNQAGTLRLQTQPQTGYDDEIDPGMRALDNKHM
jgi:ferredoxin